MLGNNSFKSKEFVLVIICAFLVLILPVNVLAESPGSGSMVGFVYGEDSGEPVQNAVVKIRNAESGAVYQNNPTDKSGYYEMADVPEGRYILGVTAEGKDYNFDHVVYIKAGETAELSLNLKEGDSTEAVPIAKKQSFFAQPFGIAVLSLLGIGVSLGTVSFVAKDAGALSESRK